MLVERLLGNLGVTVDPFATCGVAPHWSLRLPALDWVTLHFVLQGTGMVTWATGTAAVARHGLVVVPPGQPHGLTCGTPVRASAAAGDGPSTGSLAAHFAGAPNAAQLLVACGRIRATYALGLGLFDHLPQPLVVDFSDTEQIPGIFAALLGEQQRGEAGRDAMMAALMSQCLVLVFRRLCSHPDCPLPWLQALADPRLARALDAMLTAPQRHHSLESLARTAGMSRSAFARHFQEVMGHPPMDYLRSVRLREAAGLLQRSELSVDAVAAKVGFASRSHFSRAFRNHFGSRPTAYRNNT